jgi:phage terminase large subunit
VHRLLTDQIDLLGLPGFEITDHEIRHENGSLFLFEGLRHNVTKIKSLEGIDIAWVEEAERVSKTSWDVLIPTIRKAGSEIWVNFNPDLEDDPTYVRFVVNPPPNAWVARSRATTIRGSPRSSRPSARTSTPSIPTRPRTSGAASAGVERAQILHGKWIVEEFEPEPDVGWPVPRRRLRLRAGPEHAREAAGSRRARSPKSTGRLMIEREAYKVGQDTDDIPEHWKREVPGCEQYVIRADSARPETISYLARHGFPQITGVEKWSGSVEDGIAHLRQYEKIVIHPRCTHAADEARHYSYKVDERTGDILPESSTSTTTSGTRCATRSRRSSANPAPACSTTTRSRPPR